MTRAHDWPSKLEKFVSENRTRSFQWGTWDCCLWVASAIEAITGMDVAAPYRGQYADANGAARICVEACGKADLASMAAYVASQNQMPEIPVLRAQRGDMLLLKDPANPGSQCLGMVAFNGHQAIVVGSSGMLPVDIAAHAVRAWRVG